MNPKTFYRLNIKEVVYIAPLDIGVKDARILSITF